MLCLSVQQPWAECLVGGRKRLEIRTWMPPLDLREEIEGAGAERRNGQAKPRMDADGRRNFPLLAIHAGRHFDALAPSRVREIAGDVCEEWGSPPGWERRVGGIVGMARLVGYHWYRTDLDQEEKRPAFYVPGRELWEREAELHLNPLVWWRVGLCAWEFAYPVRLVQMVPLRGQLGVWELPAEVVGEIEREVANG